MSGRFLPMLWLGPLLCVGMRAVGDDSAAVDHFEKRVRPLLVSRCHKCHAGDVAKGGLRLDSAGAVRKGGETGPAVLPGKPDESLLIQAVRHQNGLEMPPDGKLSDAQIADLVQWVRQGLVWPDAAPAAIPSSTPTAQGTSLSPNDSSLAPHLQLWLRADVLTLNDGEAVTVWPDQSGHARDFSATRGIRSGGVGQPAQFVRESLLRKRPAVRFQPASGLAASADNPLPIEGDAGTTIILVLDLPPQTAPPAHLGIFGLGDPANSSGDPERPLAFLVQINRDEDHALHLAGGFNHDVSLGPGSFKSYFGKALILTVRKEPGPMNRTTRFFLNGQANDTPNGEAQAGTQAVPDIRNRTDIGAYLGQALPWGGGFHGDIGEVIVYDKALSDEERLGVEAYLSEKFAITLPSQIEATRVTFTPEELAHWAYQPVKAAVLPRVTAESWIKSPIDRFILAELERQGLPPAPPADKRTLLRRATFDLTGLPPTPKEIDSYLEDDSPEAFEKVVNRLLESPQYGERWGRHWLDVVRYAETTANDANAVMRYAWRYRNYVIDAFNRDLPYDEFIREQLAGDVMPPTDDLSVRIRRVIATGFLMVGAKALAETDKEQSRLDIVDDQIDVVGRAFLGLTIACARCHDHKFDAVRTVDYYALAGILRSTEPFRDESRNATMWWEFPLFQAPGEEPFVVMAPKETLPRNLRVHVRGNRFTLGAVVPRGVLQVLGAATESASPAWTSEGSGRWELAQWIADRRNPLTARVMVNRIWQNHFGRGLVGTSDNFGTRGERPSHPELLDWLASQFVERGWSVKSLHRLIMLSSTYQQACRPSPAAGQRDPDNRLLSYFPRRRLAAEELRDAVLAVSGQLDLKPATSDATEVLWKAAEVIDDKRGFRPNRMQVDHPIYTEFMKRSVYLPVVRNQLPDVLSLFDAADPNGVTPLRNDTTVPSQSLFLLNSVLIRQQARAFAQQLLADSQAGDDDRLRRAHERALGRPPTDVELQEGREFLAAYVASTTTANSPSDAETVLAAWQSYCQALFCLNEFLYVD